MVPGYLLLILLGNQGILGKWLHQTLGITVAFTWVGAVIASAVMALPLMVRAVRLAVIQVDSGLEAAARTPGREQLTRILQRHPAFVGTGHRHRPDPGLQPQPEVNSAPPSLSSAMSKAKRAPLPLAIYTYTQMPGGDVQALRLVIPVYHPGTGRTVRQRADERRALRLLGNKTLHA